MPEVVVQVVQHLRPGGLEVMALDLLRHAPAGVRVHLVSLDGDRASALAAWPRLAEFATGLTFLGKRDGLDRAAGVPSRPPAAPAWAPPRSRPTMSARCSMAASPPGSPASGGSSTSSTMPGISPTRQAARLHRRLVRWLRPTIVAVSRDRGDRVLGRHLGRTGIAVIANGVDTVRYRARRPRGCPSRAGPARRHRP